MFSVLLSHFAVVQKLEGDGKGKLNKAMKKMEDLSFFFFHISFSIMNTFLLLLFFLSCHSLDKLLFALPSNQGVSGRRRNFCHSHCSKLPSSFFLLCYSAAIIESSAIQLPLLLLTHFVDEAYSTNQQPFFFFQADLISVDGSIRVLSDDFSVSLLNPQSDAYRQKALKYSQKVKLSVTFHLLLNYYTVLFLFAACPYRSVTRTARAT